MLKVSIIIPCRNEKSYIAKCIDSILSQDYPHEYLDVIICDGCSDDGTLTILEEYCQQYRNVCVLVNQHKTTPHALNIGLKKSQADVKIILGAHSEIHSDYVNNCIACFDLSPEIGCVGGVLNNVYEGKTSAAIGLAMSSPFGVGNSHFRTGAKNGYVDTVAFGAYRKEVFESIGYFDENLIRNQDDEFNFRLLKSGRTIYLSNTIRANYYVRASYRKLVKQYYQYGYWKVFVNKKHRVITSMRQLIPFVFVLFLFSLPLFVYFKIPEIFGAILLFYGTLGIYSAKKVASSFLNIPSIVFTFFILHFSYGLGYLEGVFNFLLLGRNPKKSSTISSR